MKRSLAIKIAPTLPPVSCCGHAYFLGLFLILTATGVTCKQFQGKDRDAKPEKPSAANSNQYQNNCRQYRIGIGAFRIYPLPSYLKQRQEHEEPRVKSFSAKQNYGFHTAILMTNKV